MIIFYFDRDLRMCGAGLFFLMGRGVIVSWRVVAMGASPARVSSGDFLGEFFDASTCFRVSGISGIH